MRRPGAGLILLTFAAYLPVWSAGFVWNDADYVTRPALRSLHGLWLIWSRPGATEQYYPLLHSAFWLEYHLWGPHAAGYHVANVALHAANAVLFSSVLRRLLGPGSEAPAWLAAALFAVHPVMTESVAWISEQKNTLSLLFYLLSARAYLAPPEQRRSRVWALPLFICALLSKTTTATLPAALLLVAWWKGENVALAARRISGWIVLAAAAGLFSAWVERTYVGAKGAAFALTFGQRLALAGRIPWFYVGKLVWPFHLAFIYPRWEIPLGAASTWAGLAATLALTAACAGAALRWRGPLAIWLFFVGSLFPTLGFLNVYAFIYSYVADHWDYIPALAIFAGAGWAIAAAAKRWPAPRVWGAGIAALLLALAVRADEECLPYRNAGVFYRTIVARNPAAWMAENNLAELLAHAGRPEDALPYYNAALQHHIGAPEILYNRGAAFLQLGWLADAEADFRAAVAAAPQFALAKKSLADIERRAAIEANNAGVSALSRNDAAGAARLFASAVQRDSGYATAWANLGRALIALGRPATAIDPLEEALRLEPASPDAENDLGAVFMLLHRPAEAIPHYKAALRLRPEFPAAARNLREARQAAGS